MFISLLFCLAVQGLCISKDNTSNTLTNYLLFGWLVDLLYKGNKGYSEIGITAIAK